MSRMKIFIRGLLLFSCFALAVFFYVLGDLQDQASNQADKQANKLSEGHSEDVLSILAPASQDVEDNAGKMLGHDNHEGCHDCSHSHTAQPEAPVVQLTTVPGADAVFKALAAAPEKERTAYSSIHGELSRSVRGQSLVLQLGPLSLGGVAGARKESPRASSYAMELADPAPGRLILHRDGNGQHSGQVFFYGDSRVVEIVPNRLDDQAPDLKLQEVSVADVFCAPTGAIYTRNGIRMAKETSGMMNEPFPKQYPPLAGEAAPAELDSREDSEYVIYLDFDGEAVNDPVWGVIDAVPHPLANDVTFVTNVWRRVVEDFAAFDINITTKRTVFDAAEEEKRLQVIITPTDDAFPNVGGVALIGSFRQSSPICWVFNLSEYACANTISHEAGHTFGLLHDGKTDGTEYYAGHNEGYAAGWAPIMGAAFIDGFYDEVDSWSKGEYAGANRLQDDIAIIGSNSNGFGHVEDDYADTINPSNSDAPLGSLEANDDNQFVASGTITERSDVDLFLLSLNDGNLEITVSSLDVDSSGSSGEETQGGNLAIDTRLLDQNGAELMVGQAYGDVLLGSRIETQVQAGTYYLEVGGGGRGNNASDGFSDYASLGQYSITAAFPPAPLSVSGGSKHDQAIANGSIVLQEVNSTDFGFSYPGRGAIARTFLLTNLQDSDLTNLAFSFASGADFSFDTGLSLPESLPGKASTYVRLLYSPNGQGLHRDTVIVTFNAGSQEEFRFDVGGTSTKSATEDNYETNNYSNQAYDLNGVEDVWLSEYKGRAFFMSWWMDFYTFTVQPDDDLITIDIDYDGLDSTITFGLFNNWGVELLSTTETNGQLRYRIPENFTGLQRKFFIRADIPSDTPGIANLRNEYDLRWSAISFTGGTDDLYESNNSQSEAYELTGAASTRLSGISGEGVQSDDDWYKITIPSNPYYRMLHIAATFDHDEGDIDIEVFHEGDPFFRFTNDFSTSSVTQNDKEVVTVSGTVLLESYVDDFFPEFNTIVSGVEPGTYYIRVHGDNAGNSYDLVVEPLIEDKYEYVNDQGTRNNNLANAWDLGDEIVGKWLSQIDGAGTVGDYSSSPDNPNQTFSNRTDTDYYRIDLSSSGRVQQLFLDFRSYSASLEVSLYNSSGGLAIREEDIYLEQISLGSVTDSVYYVRVRAAYDVDALSNYDFRVTVSSTPPPVADAVEDNYEENDNFQQLYDLTGNAGFWLTSVDGYGVQLDPDWYEIAVPQGASKLVVRAAFDASQGNIDLTLSEKDGPIVFQSEGTGDVEEIVWDNPAPGAYAVTLTGDRNGNSYNLFWDVIRPDDDYEENDSLNAAHDLSASEGIWLRKVSGEAIQKDADWYKVTVPVGTAQLQIRTAFDPDEGDIDLDLYNQAGYLVARSVSSTQVESIFYDNPAPGEYFILAHYGNAGNEYDLWWGVFTQIELDLIELNQDAYEQNDSQSEAFRLQDDEVALSDLPEGLATQSDDDWYRITIGADNTGLEVTCTFSHDLGDIDLEIVDSRGVPIIRRDSLTDNESVVFRTPLEEGDYYLRVYGANKGNEYDLYWVMHERDDFESNDTQQTAYNLADNIGTPLSSLGSAVQGEDDWYRFDVSGDYAHLFVQLDYVHANGNIDFEIFNSGGNRIHYALDANDSTSVFLPVQTGTHYVRVFGDDRFNSYNLLVDVRNDDAYEQNDDRASAADITGLQDEAIFAAQFDADWYEVSVTGANSFVVASATYIHANGNIGIELYDSSGNQLAQSTGTLTTEQAADPDYVHTKTLSHGVAAGKYYLLFSGDDRNQQYSFFWSSKQDDANDTGTGNDTSGDATPLPDPHDENDPGTKVDGVQLDDDWYIVAVPAGHVQLNVDLEFIHAGGDINLEVYDSTLQRIGSAASTTDDESLKVGCNPAGGNHYIRVHGSNLGNEYKIFWSSSSVDAYEDGGNNIFANASTSILELESTYLSDALGYATSADEDWYRIEIAAGDDGLVIEALFDDALGNIDIELYNSLQVRVAGSTNDDVNEEHIYYEGTAGVYYIRVFGDLAGNYYNLFWNSYKEDELEEWDPAGPDLPVQNDTSANANAVEFLELVPHTELTQADDDWYGLSVADGDDLLRIRCEFTHAAGDVNLTLYRSGDTTTPVSTSNSSSNGVDFEEILLSGPGSGDFLLLVDGVNLANTYSLRWNSTSEDTFEENDTRQAANDLGELNEQEALSVTTRPAEDAVQLDEDWYYVDVIAGGRHFIEARIEFDADQGDLDLELYDQAGERIGQADGQGSPKVVSLFGDGNQRYYVRVTGDDFGLSYTLTVRNAPDDPYEQNDSTSEATDIRTLLTVPGSLVQNDDDYFLLSVPMDQVHLNFTIDKGDSEDLQATLYDAANNQIDSISLGEEFVGAWEILVSPVARNYYLRISGDNVGSTYTLAWSTSNEDNYEDNDSFIDAYDLTPARLQPVYDRDAEYENPITSLSFGTELGHATSTDEDWYQLKIPSWRVVGTGNTATIRRIFNVRLQVQLSFAHANGNIDLQLYDSGMQAQASSTSQEDSESVDIEIDPLSHEDIYYIRVFGAKLGNSYSLTWEAISTDNYEKNNFVDKAHPLYGAGEVNTWLNEIDGYGTQTTDDWYAVVASGGSTQLLVDCVYYSDTVANIDIDVYQLVGDTQRKPVLVGRFDGGTSVADPRAGPIDAGLTAYSEAGTLDVTGKPGIYFIRVYFDNQGVPYTLRWNDGVVADDTAIIDDYTAGDWNYIPANELPSALLQAPAANLDGDAYPNWAEYALGLDASVPDYAVIGQSTETFSGERYFQFEYLRTKEAVVRGYEFIVEESTDMTFDGSSAVHVRTESVDQDIERVIYRSTRPVAERDRCFFRLKVEEAPVK